MAVFHASLQRCFARVENRNRWLRLIPTKAPGGVSLAPRGFSLGRATGQRKARNRLGRTFRAWADALRRRGSSVSHREGVIPTGRATGPRALTALDSSALPFPRRAETRFERLIPNRLRFSRRLNKFLSRYFE